MGILIDNTNAYAYVCSWMRTCPELTDSDLGNIISDALMNYGGAQLQEALDRASDIVEMIRGKSFEELHTILYRELVSE